MPLTPAQLSALKTEFTNDPRGYGYAQYWTTGYDGALNFLINAARDGVVRVITDVTISLPTTPTGAGGSADGIIKINNASVDTGQIRAAVTFAAFDGLVTASRQWFDWLTANGFISVNAHLLQSLAGIPTATGSIWALADRTAMNAAMESLMRKFGSRAEELFGVGVVVSTDDVSRSHAAA